MFIQVLLKDPLYFLAVIAVIIVSVSLHEMGHALAAYYLEGDDTAQKQGFLKFNPWVQMGPTSLLFLAFFGICWGLTPVNPARFRHGRVGESLVAMAGLWVNGLLLLASLALLSLYGNGQSLMASLLFLMASKNALLLVLNLLPIPPLDGFAVLSPWLPGRGQAIAQYGPFLLMLLFVVLGAGQWLVLASELLLRLLWKLFPKLLII